MSRTEAVQRKDVGSALCTDRYSLMAAVRAATLTNEPRRIRLVVNALNQHSTRFSQDDDVNRPGKAGDHMEAQYPTGDLLSSYFSDIPLVSQL